MNSLEREIRARLVELFPTVKEPNVVPKLGKITSLRIAISEGLCCIQIRRERAEIQVVFPLENPSEDVFFHLEGKDATEFLKRPSLAKSAIS